MSRGTLSPATLRKVILHSSSAQSDCSLSWGLTWLMSMSLMIQKVKQQSSQDHYTLTTLSVYTKAMWPVLKSLIPCKFNIILIPLIFSKVTILIKCILTVQCKHLWSQHKTEDNRTERNYGGGAVGFKSHCTADVIYVNICYGCWHHSETEVCAPYVHSSVDRATPLRKTCLCSLSVSDPVPRLSGSFNAHIVSKRIWQLVFSH